MNFWYDVYYVHVSFQVDIKRQIMINPRRTLELGVFLPLALVLLVLYHFGFLFNIDCIYKSCSQFARCCPKLGNMPYRKFSKNFVLAFLIFLNAIFPVGKL